MYDQSVLIDKILAANLAREFRGSVTSPFVFFHIDHTDTHKATLGTWHSLWRVRFLHVSVKHELLRIILPTGNTLERTIDAMRYPQVCNQSGNEVKFCLTQFADLLTTLKSATKTTNV